MKALILNIPKLVFYNIIQKKKIVFVPKLVEFGIKSSIACFLRTYLTKSIHLKICKNDPPDQLEIDGAVFANFWMNC